jgi:large subunit ribosomal protein L16|uniref:Ribosomal protein L16 n=2 Tax=Ulva TaxID=3118 RepID=A0A222AIM8_ULVPE|nr:ribosomal protein L16 [Ulva pertusa]YP_010021445.1 ribosomal protein L16 [Ulva australis]ASO76187.1 ribosomal protein L16 [Ulva pertusa]ASO76229.1 ribosomal protein L16 [Ulva pertusa]QOL10286.1 ribosomal protein L16 [Ulva australis]
MATIPKKLAFKLYFRKKTKTRKLIYRERKLRQLGQNTNAVFLRSLNSVTTSKLLDLVPIKKPLPLKQCNLNPVINPYPLDRGVNFQGLLERSNGVFYSKQKQNAWPVYPNHVYLKTQMNCSVSSKRLLFGLYGIYSVQHATISAAYIETIKLDIAKTLKKKGRVWTRICCDCPVSARPAETRMGKGKGSISHWVARVRPGQLLFEFSGITKPQLDEIFQKLCKKTSIGLSIIS